MVAIGYIRAAGYRQVSAVVHFLRLAFRTANLDVRARPIQSVISHLYAVVGILFADSLRRESAVVACHHKSDDIVVKRQSAGKIKSRDVVAYCRVSLILHAVVRRISLCKQHHRMIRACIVKGSFKRRAAAYQLWLVCVVLITRVL